MRHNHRDQYPFHRHPPKSGGYTPPPMYDGQSTMEVFVGLLMWCCVVITLTLVAVPTIRWALGNG